MKPIKSQKINNNKHQTRKCEIAWHVISKNKFKPEHTILNMCNFYFCDEISLMHDGIRQTNFTTKPHF